MAYDKTYYENHKKEIRKSQKKWKDKKRKETEKERQELIELGILTLKPKLTEEERYAKSLSIKNQLYAKNINGYADKVRESYRTKYKNDAEFRLKAKKRLQKWYEMKKLYV